jgi:hypothetical protein
MNSRIQIFIIFALCSGLMACEMGKKSQAVEKVATVACQDARDMITAHANDIVPIVGKLILNLAVKEEVQKGAICECLSPAVKQYLDKNYQEAELDNMLIDKNARKQAIKKAFSENSREIFQCYKDKGLKGVKLIENFINKIIK